jgi:hypothetical protein
MEELALKIPSSDMNFVSELATRMGWVLTKLVNWTGITTSDEVVAVPKQKKIKLPKGNGKTTQEAMEWVKSLAIKGGVPVPADEDGRNCRTEKYL